MRIEHRPQHDRRLGRQLVHDEASRGFTLPTAVDRSTWHDKLISIFDPVINPNQEIGCCTGVAKAIEFNSAGNRVSGVINDMDDAIQIYSHATTIDPWDGSYPPDDTGSSGLAAAKASQQEDRGRGYDWIFGGADQAIQIMMGLPDIPGRCVNVGTWWKWDMFNQDADGKVSVSGGDAGGHQYIIHGYWQDRDWVMGRCWWGDFRDFWITRDELDGLLRDGGDAHCQRVDRR